jgi:hypothetical protein
VSVWAGISSAVVRSEKLSRKIAFAGIFTGIAVVLLYIGAIIPTGKLTLYFLASLPVAFTIIEFGARAGIAVYFAACILSVLVAGNIYGMLPFALLFGHYPIFKCFIERRRKVVVEVVLKLAVFNISVFFGYLFFKNLFMPELPANFTKNVWLLVVFCIASQGLFFIYDYVFSRLLFYYESRLRIFKRE